MQGYGATFGVALMEVVTLEDARHGEVAQELEQVGHLKAQDPFGVVAQRRAVGIEDLECLVDICPGVFRDLLGRKLRTRGIASRRIADQRRSVADDERDAMAEILELAKLAQRDGMPEMDVRRRRIDAKLDVEGNALFQLLEKKRFRNHLVGTGRDDMKLFFGSYRTHLLYIRFSTAIRAS